MRLGDFEMEIIGGTETQEGYVGLTHGQKYSVRIVNHGSVPCDARMSIDGLEVGLFRIPPRSRSEIERPTGDSGHFTFFELHTPQAVAAGISKNEETGLVQTTFMPGKAEIRNEPPSSHILFSSSPPKGDAGSSETNASDKSSLKSSTEPGLSCDGFAPSDGITLYSSAPQTTLGAGGTGLSGKSSQEFITASRIDYASADKFVTITLRLGGKRLDSVRPLPNRLLANPVPPPL